MFLAACWRRVAAASADRPREGEIAMVEKVCSDEASIQDLHDAGFDNTQGRVEEILNGPSFDPVWFTGLVNLLRSWTPEQERAEKLTQVNLLRCIIGNLTHQQASIRPGCVGTAGAIPSLAETIHRERRFGEFPVLADALEEAGCDDCDILGHCRTRREHAFGCWALTLLRSKLAVRLVLSEPEARLTGWRPDTVVLENVGTEPIAIAYHHSSFDRLGLLTLDETGEVVDHQEAVVADGAWAPTQATPLGPGETLRHHLGPTRSLKPGIYTMQALYRHGGIDLRSRAFLFTVPSQG
ncbi:MAG: hypothetical protein U0797_03040 [Gemmataceae bacterium]